MKDFILEPTKDTLKIECRKGYVELAGNSILPNAQKFFQPVSDWLDEYVKKPADKTEVNLNFNYVDTSSVQMILNLLKQLREIPEYESSVIINWYFEFDDPELLEIGEIMEGRLGIKFNFIEGVE